MFNEKLNMIMELTKTSNNELGVAASIDASYVSRLRSGGRRLSKDPAFLIPMANYLSKKVKSNSQKASLQEMIMLTNELPDNIEDRAQIIYKWFTYDEQKIEKSIESFLENFSMAHSLSFDLNLENDIKPKTLDYYIGVDGKREAVIRLLTQIIDEKKPQTLYIFSDENYSWLTESNDFCRMVIHFLMAAIKKGNKIKFIHTSNNEIHDTFFTICKWMPIYLTGAIEPYFYPKTRDGIYRRSLIIAPNTGAIISDSIMENTHGMLNIYTTDKLAINALRKEFNDYLAICMPLMSIYTVEKQKEYRNELREFNKQSADMLIAPPYLSQLSLPEDLQRDILKRAGVSADIISYNPAQKATELLTLPDPQLVRDNAVPIALINEIISEDIYYTKEQFIQHLEHIIELIANNRNYNAIINDQTNLQYSVYVKENTGVVIALAKSPSIVFVINEPNITAAFADYLMHKVGKQKKDAREKTIASLKSYIARI